MKLWRFFRFLSLIAAGGLAACSNQYSSLEASGKGSVLYTLSEDEALQLAHATMLSTFPGRAITSLGGPTRGYSTYTRFVLDTFTQQVVIVSATGKTDTGATVAGCYFEVSGSGSSGSGKFRNQEFAENLRASFDRTGKAVTVTNVQIAPPRSTPTPGPAPGDPMKQIERLKALLDQGAITRAEYDAKKAELMKRI